MVTKVTLNVPTDLLEEAKAIARNQNISVSDVFRRGLQTDVFLTKEENSGGKVLVERKNGKMVEIFRPR